MVCRSCTRNQSCCESLNARLFLPRWHYFTQQSSQIAGSYSLFFLFCNIALLVWLFVFEIGSLQVLRLALNLQTSRYLPGVRIKGMCYYAGMYPTFAISSYVLFLFVILKQISDTYHFILCLQGLRAVNKARHTIRAKTLLAPGECPVILTVS